MDFKKLTSGKFWLTIIAGLVFGYTSAKRILPPEAVAALLGVVFVSYFNKDKNGS